jgi:hypothetical protein
LERGIRSTFLSKSHWVKSRFEQMRRLLSCKHKFLDKVGLGIFEFWPMFVRFGGPRAVHDELSILNLRRIRHSTGSLSKVILGIRSNKCLE